MFSYLTAACLGVSLLAGATPAAAAPPNLDIDTIAGQPATGQATQVAQQPFGLAVEPGRGRTLVADPANHVVRAVVPPACDGPCPLSPSSEFTIAGDGGMGSEGDGGDPAVAQLAGPYALAVVSDGNASVVYVADTFAHRIRSFVDGDVGPVPLTTVAGTGSFGFSGDGGPAGAAQLDSPYGLAVTPGPQGQRWLYIADTLNNRIRAVRPDGTIVTVAGTGAAGLAGDGGPATSAELNRPRGLALDCLGHLYIADTGNNVVRRYDPATGIISTAAGTGAAGYGGDGGPAAHATLRQPAAVAVDQSCDLYVADTGNNAVRKVSGGAITTVAGNGTAGYTGDGTLATGAELSSPFALAVQPDGTLLIGDTGNNVIRGVSSQGVISTIAGNGTASLSADGEGQPQLAGVTSVDHIGGRTQPLCGQTTSPTQTLVLDTFNHALRAICGSQTFNRIGNGRPGQLAYPMGMALDGPNIYIADTFNNVVRMLDTTTMTPSVVAGTGSAGFSGDGGPASSAQLDYPTALAVDHDHNLYIADTYNDRIRKVDPATHTITTIAGTGILGSGGDGGPGTQAQLFFPFGLAVDTSSPANVYIADSFNNRIRRLDPGGVISTLAGTGVAGYKDGPAAAAQFDRPWGIAVDAASTGPNVYVADYLNHRIRVIDPTGVSTVAGTGLPGLAGDFGPAVGAEANAPRGVTALDNTGTLLVADSFNERVRRIGLGSIQVPGSVDFGSVRTGTVSTQNVTVTNNGTGYFRLTQVSSSDPQIFPASGCLGSGLTPGQSCTISITYQPHTPGPPANEGNLRLAADSGKTATVRLSGTGIEPAVTLFAADGKTPLQQPVTMQAFSPTTIIVRNTGTADLHISRLQVPQQPLPSTFNATLCSGPTATVAPNTDCPITVTYSGVASSSATLVITDDARPAPQQATQTVDLQGFVRPIG